MSTKNSLTFKAPQESELKPEGKWSFNSNREEDVEGSTAKKLIHANLTHFINKLNALQKTLLKLAAPTNEKRFRAKREWKMSARAEEKSLKRINFSLSLINLLQAKDFTNLKFLLFLVFICPPSHAVDENEQKSRLPSPPRTLHNWLPN